MANLAKLFANRIPRAKEINITRRLSYISELWDGKLKFEFATVSYHLTPLGLYCENIRQIRDNKERNVQIDFDAT